MRILKQKFQDPIQTEKFIIIAACVPTNCKECNVPRSSNEIAKKGSLENTVMTKKDVKNVKN